MIPDTFWHENETENKQMWQLFYLKGENMHKRKDFSKAEP